MKWIAPSTDLLPVRRLYLAQNPSFSLPRLFFSGLLARGAALAETG